MALEDQQTRAKELYYVIGRACYHQGLEHMPNPARQHSPTRQTGQAKNSVPLGDREQIGRQ